MAARYTIAMPTPFSIATATKTTLMAIAPAGHGLVLISYKISFDGVTSSAVPATVEIVRSTQAGAGTSGVSPTITLVGGRVTSGSAPTGGSNYSAEPTTLTAVDRFYVSQYMGLVAEPFPLGREIEIDSSAGTVLAVGLRVTTTATVNCLATLYVETL